MLFQTCSFRFLAVLNQVMTSTFRTKPTTILLYKCLAKTRMYLSKNAHGQNQKRMHHSFILERAINSYFEILERLSVHRQSFSNGHLEQHFSEIFLFFL